MFGLPRPERNGILQLKGITAPIEIVWDQWDIPHIYASNKLDVIFAQGYIHAQERLWQMDFNRRLVAGRLSEILGKEAIPLDRWMRILGMRRVSEKQPSAIDKETISILDSYAAGVNAFIEKEKFPVEISLLGYKPEQWTIVDSISWVKMMAWDLCVNWEAEILRAQIITQIGSEKAAELEPGYAKDQPLIIPPGVDYSCIGSEAVRRATKAKPLKGSTAKEGLGSNNWVLSGKRTSTGMPLLANDMHLQMNIPPIWYENHLVADDLNVTGISFPGIPLVIGGHNEKVAWGFTNGFTDVQDLYIERLRRTKDNLVEYEFKDNWLEAEVFWEEIQVKDGNPILEEIIVTHHGPIINSLSPDFIGESPLALRWTAFELDNGLSALLQMNLAENCEEFREALRRWTLPAQNIVYADVEGNIGYSLPGKLPIRANGNGRVPVPGWTGEYEWVGYVPYEELPHLFNPPQEYIATANNKVVDDDYPHWIGYEYVSGNRAQRIVELIEAKEKLSVEDIGRMQMDQTSPAARKVAKVLGELKSDSPELDAVLEKMRFWDGNLLVDSAEAAIYEVFIRKIIFCLLEIKLGPLTEHYAGKGPLPIIQEGSMLGERSREWILETLGTPLSPWFDLSDGLAREDHLLGALQESIDFLKATCGPSMEDWEWGKLHQITFSHPLGSVKPLDRFFNCGPYPLGGDGDTIWAAFTTLQDLSNNGIVGPPFRFIADLSNWNNSLGILAPGQSGHPFNPSYSKNIQAWLNGEYHPMLFDREVVMGAVDSILLMEPL
jgi:penicillin amidase